MNDKELLELAALAAGYKFISWLPVSEFLEVTEEDGTVLLFNPLNDDGDALRLAVMLTMHVDVLSNMTRVEIPQYDIWLIEHADNSPSKYPQAKYEAARRAIVRAAAEIGKTL